MQNKQSAPLGAETMPHVGHKETDDVLVKRMLTRAAIEAHFVATGEWLEASTLVRMPAVSPGLRARVAPFVRGPRFNQQTGAREAEEPVLDFHFPREDPNPAWHYETADIDVDETWIEDAVTAADAVGAERDARRAEAERMRELAKQERARWIDQHGSSYLRKAHGAGYDCQRQYVTERAQVEHPGYTVDFDERTEWKTRPCPSQQALDEALAVGGQVVWVTRPEPAHEGVMIGPYLGKYTLIRRP